MNQITAMKTLQHIYCGQVVATYIITDLVIGVPGSPLHTININVVAGRATVVLTRCGIVEVVPPHITALDVELTSAVNAHQDVISHALCARFTVRVCQNKKK